MIVKIEKLRRELKKEVNISERDFLSYSVLKLSKRLDKLIIKEMKNFKN